jgi:spermidine/putrescine transport system ATP-binding protein
LPADGTIHNQLILAGVIPFVKGSQVTVTAVSKQFGDFIALNKVSVDINKGEFFSLLGPSGCGKTTLLRLIAGFDDPTHGTIAIDNIPTAGVPPNRRHVNTIFQNYALFPHLSVFENVAFPLRIRKRPETEIRKKVGEYLALVKLEVENRKMPGRLSGGQKQRVAIARALINEPSVLLLDEPLAALDARLRQHMLVELDAIHDQIGITFIYVTHDQQEALSVSDRIAVMHAGSIVQLGTPHEIYESPADTFVASFIGESNLLHGKVVSHIDAEHVRVDVDGLGEITVFLDKPATLGDTVGITIRPEKIRISTDLTLPAQRVPNLFEGVVEELIYAGFQSKFFVRVNNTLTLKVFKQHMQFVTGEKAIKWRDKVSIRWNPNDSFIIESNRP